MFDEYDESFEEFLRELSTTNPDDFTETDWKLVRVYTRSDGCTGATNWHVKACWEHDFYSRTHHDFAGRYITFGRSAMLFRKRIQRLSWFGIFDLRSWLRWFVVWLLGRNAWKQNRAFRL